MTAPQFIQTEAVKLAGRLARDKPNWGTPGLAREIGRTESGRWRRMKWALFGTAAMVFVAGFLGEWRLLWVAGLAGFGTVYESFVATLMKEVRVIHDRALDNHT